MINYNGIDPEFVNKISAIDYGSRDGLQFLYDATFFKSTSLGAYVYFSTCPINGEPEEGLVYFYIRKFIKDRNKYGSYHFPVCKDFLNNNHEAVIADIKSKINEIQKTLD